MIYLELQQHHNTCRSYHYHQGHRQYSLNRKDWGAFLDVDRGVSPDLLHRFAAIAAGSLDKLPHNGAVITLLAVSGCTHKESYKDIFVVSVVIPMIVLWLLIVIWGLFILR